MSHTCFLKFVNNVKLYLSYFYVNVSLTLFIFCFCYFSFFVIGGVNHFWYFFLAKLLFLIVLLGVFVVFAHFVWWTFFVLGVAGLELVILEATNSMHHTQLELSS